MSCAKEVRNSTLLFALITSHFPSFSQVLKLDSDFDIKLGVAVVVAAVCLLS